jgi:hypothetical protein
MSVMRASIQEIYNNFKSLLLNDTVFFALLLVLMSVTSFGLGRLSATHPEAQYSSGAAQIVAAEPQKLQSQAQEAEKAAGSVSDVQQTSDEPQQLGDPQYVASKNGTKYHLLWCSGAKTIKEENKIYFKSKEEAEGAGYTPAANCKGI